MTAGIYAIKNKVNGKLYIGSSISIDKRWGEHKWQLRHNRHHSPALQNAWNKYGEEAFEFNIVQEVIDGESLLAAEQTFLDTHESYNREKGYNILATADRNTSKIVQSKVEENEKTKQLSIPKGTKYSHRKNNWVGFQATAAEKAKLDNHCQRMQQTKTQVLRSLINNLPSEDEEPWKSSGIVTKGQVRTWLQSLIAESDKETEMAQQLRNFSEQMITIAEYLENK